MSTLNIYRSSRYPEEMVAPMRQEVTALGFEEWRSGEDIEKNLDLSGTTFVFINSVCGCSAGSARPALKLVMNHQNLPDRLVTCFAGVDMEAVAKVRERITQYPASSPSMALFKDGELVYFMPRHQIEGRSPEQIAEDLSKAFDQYCS